MPGRVEVQQKCAGLYVIVHEHRDPETDAPLFWNTSQGWVTLADASVFSDMPDRALPREAWGVLRLPRALRLSDESSLLF